MINYIILTLCILFSAQSSYSNNADTTFSKSINQNSNIYFFNINVFRNQYSNTHYFVNIFKDSSNNLIQTINDSTEGDFNFQYPEFSIEFIDINFDGNLDLKLYDFASADGQNFAFKYWLYNNETGKFIYNENYSYKLAGMEVYIDSSINMIIVSFISGDYAMGQDRYKVIDNELLLYEEEGIFYDITKEAHFERLYRNVNGEMIIITEKPFSFKE